MHVDTTVCEIDRHCMHVDLQQFSDVNRRRLVGATVVFDRYDDLNKNKIAIVPPSKSLYNCKYDMRFTIYNIYKRSLDYLDPGYSS